MPALVAVVPIPTWHREFQHQPERLGSCSSLAPVLADVAADTAARAWGSVRGAGDVRLTEKDATVILVICSTDFFWMAGFGAFRCLAWRILAFRSWRGKFWDKISVVFFGGHLICRTTELFKVVLHSNWRCLGPTRGLGSKEVDQQWELLPEIEVPELWCGSGYPLLQLVYHCLQWGSVALCPAAFVGDLPAVTLPCWNLFLFRETCCYHTFNLSASFLTSLRDWQFWLFIFQVFPGPFLCKRSQNMIEHLCFCMLLYVLL